MEVAFLFSLQPKGMEIWYDLAEKAMWRFVMAKENLMDIMQALTFIVVLIATFVVIVIFGKRKKR